MGFYKEGRWVYDSIDEASGIGIAGTQSSDFGPAPNPAWKTWICRVQYAHQQVAIERPTCCGVLMRKVGEE